MIFIQGIDKKSGFVDLNKRDLSISYFQNFFKQLDIGKVKLSKKDFEILNNILKLNDNITTSVIETKVLPILIPYFINKYKKT